MYPQIIKLIGCLSTELIQINYLEKSTQNFNCAEREHQ